MLWPSWILSLHIWSLGSKKVWWFKRCTYHDGVFGRKRIYTLKSGFFRGQKKEFKNDGGKVGGILVDLGQLFLQNHWDYPP